MSPSEAEVANFLAHMFDQGASYSSVNAARSALSTVIPSTNKATIGSSREVYRLVKGVFEARPALPKHTNTWSVDSVLDYMCSLPEIADLTLKQLTLRTVMLLALLTGQRGHALRLKIGDIRMHHNKCVIVFSSKHKQTKPGAHTEPAEISAFTQNPKISLVGHLHAYLKQTEPLRKGQELLISFNKLHAPVARGTFSRWVKTMLAAAGNRDCREKECLALVWACESFDRYLVGLDVRTLYRPQTPGVVDQQQGFVRNTLALPANVDATDALQACSGVRSWKEHDSG